MKIGKKCLSLLLAVVMLAGLLPMTALPVYAAGMTVEVTTSSDDNILVLDEGPFTGIELTAKVKPEPPAGTAISYQWYRKTQDGGVQAGVGSTLTVKRPGTYYVEVRIGDSNDWTRSNAVTVALEVVVPVTKNVIAPDPNSEETFAFKVTPGWSVEPIDPIEPVELDMIEDSITVGDSVMQKEGHIRFSVPAEHFDAFIESGVVVTEVDGGSIHWDYDLAQWIVIPLTADTNAELIGGFDFDGNSNGNGTPTDPTESVVFTNTYYPGPFHTLTIPFTKRVERLGTAAPGRETFTFEVRDDGRGIPFEVRPVTLTTTGAGDFEGEIEIVFRTQPTPNDYPGVLVTENQGTKANWTYDSATWLAEWEPVPAGDGDFKFYKIDEKTNEPVDYDNPLDAMVFTNRYNYSPSPAESRYTLTYESNGGTEYPNETHASGTAVSLGKIPSREGFTFTGWYADKALKEKIESIKMNGDKTVYAGWRASAVPEILDGVNHFAYILGYEDDTVRPLSNITRAEVAAIFYRLLNADVRDKNKTDMGSFKDVSAEAWYNVPISTIAKLGIIKGRSADTYDPMAPITRAEFAAICARFDTSAESGTERFTDIDGHWAKAEIEKAAALGWILGHADGSFRPNQSVTRAEAVTFINRVLQRMPRSVDDLLPGMKTFKDNADTQAWYYLAIQEAANSHSYEMLDTGYEKWVKLK